MTPLQKWMIGGGFVILSYIPSTCTVQIVGSLSDRKINSQEQLEKVVKEEAPKFGLDTNNIYVEYGKHNTKMRVIDGRDSLYMRENDPFTTRNHVRHELWHLKRDGDKKRSFLYYLFVEEPRATLYEAFGWKL